MNRPHVAMVGGMAIVLVLVTVLVAPTARPSIVLALGVGRASWTPSESSTVGLPSRFLVDGDSITFRTDAVWDRSQIEGLETYVADGLRYTHEINDRDGRLTATGYWATNHPDPAFDRDDDDGDGRWEEAEITAGAELPAAGRPYTSLFQFSRWRGKRERGSCDWAWDRRRGRAEVLSQMSRDLFGEWQALRYTLDYDSIEYPRVGARPVLPSEVATARCREPRPRPSQRGVLVTFARPLSWDTFSGLRRDGSGRWTAFEAIGSVSGDDRIWTCGGPVDGDASPARCRDMGLRLDGVSAALGYFDRSVIDALREDEKVARVEDLRDAVTGLLFDVGGFGVERPDLTINDAYWDLFLAD